MKNFNQKNYLIFAGSSTIARDLIEKLKNLNANVFFTSRNEESATEIKKKYGFDFKICNDLTNFEDVEDIFKVAQEKLGVLNGVVNFSGSILLKAAHQTSFNEYLDVINKNLTTSFAVTRGAGKYLSQDSSVVLISSVAASMGIANHEAIAAAKSGVEGLIRAASCTYAAKNIRFNAIAPSLVDTNLSKMITQNEMMLNASTKMHALARIGNKQDISNACLFLLDLENSWITGQVIKVEGGFSLKSKVKA